jgi:hypothetical protein
MSAFDIGSAASSIIKDAPKLFMSATAASAAGGSIGLAGGVGVVPAALFGFTCGLAADAVLNFVKGRRECLKERHNAQFLTYPQRVRHSMNLE